MGPLAKLLPEVWALRQASQHNEPLHRKERHAAHQFSQTRGIKLLSIDVFCWHWRVLSNLRQLLLCYVAILSHDEIKHRLLPYFHLAHRANVRAAAGHANLDNLYVGVARAGLPLAPKYLRKG